jgi:hypothetical protein
MVEWLIGYSKKDKDLSFRTAAGGLFFGLSFALFLEDSDKQPCKTVLFSFSHSVEKLACFGKAKHLASDQGKQTFITNF